MKNEKTLTGSAVKIINLQTKTQEAIDNEVEKRKKQNAEYIEQLKAEIEVGGGTGHRIRRTTRKRRTSRKRHITRKKHRK